MKIHNTWAGRLFSFGCKKGVSGRGGTIAAILTRYPVEPVHKEKMTEALCLYSCSSRMAKGNLMAELYVEQGDIPVIWVIERWINKACYDEHCESDAAKELLRLMRYDAFYPVAEVLFLDDLEMLVKEEQRADLADNAQPITVMLFVEVKRGTGKYFRAINRGVMAAFAKYPDVLTFRLSSIKGNKTQFVVFKKFRNREAFQFHLKDPAVALVIKFLETSVKEPPFEKGYHHLVEVVCGS